VAGILSSAGVAFYIAPILAPPRDTLMLVGARRTRFRIGIVARRSSCAHSVPASHWAAPSASGRLLFAVLVGPIVEASFAVLARTPIAFRRPTRVPVVIGE